MADYYITKKRMDAEKKHIEKVKYRYAYSNSVGTYEFEKKRSEIIKSIEVDKKKYRTAIEKNGEWIIGEDVHVVPIKGKKYIRTDKNETEEDNLGNLPEF